MKELFKRLSLPTPAFFKKVMLVGASLVALSIGLAAVPNVPGFLVTISGYLATAGGIMIAVGKAAVTNPEDLKK
jgi:ABC-type xylose transport system permease subunit